MKTPLIPYGCWHTNKQKRPSSQGLHRSGPMEVCHVTTERQADRRHVRPVRHMARPQTVDSDVFTPHAIHGRPVETRPRHWRVIIPFHSSGLIAPALFVPAPRASEGNCTKRARKGVGTARTDRPDNPIQRLNPKSMNITRVRLRLGDLVCGRAVVGLRAYCLQSRPRRRSAADLAVYPGPRLAVSGPGGSRRKSWLLPTPGRPASSFEGGKARVAGSRVALWSVGEALRGDSAPRLPRPACCAPLSLFVGLTSAGPSAHLPTFLPSLPLRPARRSSPVSPCLVYVFRLNYSLLARVSY